MVEGSVQVAILALGALATDLVVLALDMVVTEGAGADVHCIPARGAVLHVPYTGFPCPFPCPIHKMSLPIHWVSQPYTSFPLPVHKFSTAHTKGFQFPYTGFPCP